MERAVRNKTLIDSRSLEEEFQKIDGYEELKAVIPEGTVERYSSMWLAVKALENDKVVVARLKNTLPADAVSQIDAIRELGQGAVATGSSKFAWIDEVLDGAVASKTKKAKQSKLDKIYLNPFWGKPAVVLTILLGLIASFIPALPLMGVGMAVGSLKTPVAGALASAGCPEVVIALLCNVLIQSLSYIFQMLGFVFGVTLVFGFLEEVGVMARISYVFDNTMGKLGLQGKSVMPFLVSFGCTMGGAAGARVIDNWGQKVLTIALAWAVPCGAAWSVVPMLSTLFFGSGAILVMAAILATMLLHMFITAKIFGRRLVDSTVLYGWRIAVGCDRVPYWIAHFLRGW